jgi:hypothetical protein
LEPRQEQRQQDGRHAVEGLEWTQRWDFTVGFCVYKELFSRQRRASERQARFAYTPSMHRKSVQTR